MKGNTSGRPSGVPQIGQLKGAGRLFLGPFAEKGRQVDAWADVVEGMASKAQDLLNAFEQGVKDAEVPQLDLKEETLKGGGLQAERRSYRIVERGPGLVAVYVAGWGEDLYVSWRLFASPLSSQRIRNWLIACGAFGLLPSMCSLCSGVGGLSTMARRTGIGGRLMGAVLGLFGAVAGILASIIGTVLTLSVLAALVGWLAARDPLLVWRKPLDEFAQDEVSALSIDVHKKLLRAIDAVGIDVSLLMDKESFALSGHRSRTI